MSKAPININVGSRVQHRAWFWYASVVEIPSTVYWTSVIGVKIDGEESMRRIPVFSLISDTNDFIYDWSDVDEGIKGRSTSAGKEP